MFVEQLATARPRTPTPAWPRIDEVLLTNIQQAVRGDVTVQEALDAAADRDRRPARRVRRLTDPTRVASSFDRSHQQRSSRDRSDRSRVRSRRPRPGVGGAGQRRAGLAGLAFVLPGFALYALVMLYPAVQALLISLRDYNIVPGASSPWIGLDHYQRALEDPVLRRSFVNAVFYTAVTVPAQVVIGLFLAVLLDAKLPGRTLFRVLFYIPVITSWVVVSLLFQYLFATDRGFVNWVLVDVLHLVDDNVNWLGDRWPAMITISLLGIWKGVGWSMLIFLAALTGVPRELHEAAAIDGASSFGRFRNVSLPLIRGALATVRDPADDRRLQRVHVGTADDRRRPARPDAGPADVHVRAGLRVPRVRLRLGDLVPPDDRRARARRPAVPVHPAAGAGAFA